MRESSVSDKSILSPVRSARSQIIKTNERDRRQNEELAHTKNALLQAQSKNTTMATIAEKWKRRAFEAERTCREVTEREHKARTQYESQLQAKEKAYHQLSEESKETIQHLEDINKKLKKENTLLKVKERMTHGANTHAPPAVVEKPTCLATTQNTATAV
ncbi:hypothetical protein BDF14DRAFT_1394078 [Spinellus fusiger]|nr:hypothetical protein BDF14DRAFT_1394078 [Spinellus fusiger]